MPVLDTPKPTGRSATPSIPAPAIVFPEIDVVPGVGSTPSAIIGLARNDSGATVQDVDVTIDLLDASGGSIGTIAARLLLTHLQPGASSPFVASIPFGLEPAGARARLSAFGFSARTQLDLEVEEASAATAADEGTEVLGLVSNRGHQAAKVENVILTWRAADGALAGVARADVTASILPAGESLPWIAGPLDAAPQMLFDAFVSAIPANPPFGAGLELASGPTWWLTAQGHGFATGAIRNDGPAAVLPEVAVSLTAQGQLVGLEILRSSVPLAAGETLVFTAETFDSLEDRLRRLGVGMQDVAPHVVLWWTEPEQPSASPVVLPVTVRQFEVIGSRLFLRGAITHPGSVRLASLMVYVTLRSTNGEPQTARWLSLAPPAPGGRMDFAIDLPLPGGIDAAMSEYDLRALGLPLAP